MATVIGIMNYENVGEKFFGEIFFELWRQICTVNRFSDVFRLAGILIDLKGIWIAPTGSLIAPTDILVWLIMLSLIVFKKSCFLSNIMILP